MSSILDALNKLEQEKAAKQSQPGEYTPTLSPEEAALALIGESSTPKDARRKSLWLAVVLALFGGFVLAMLPLGYIVLTQRGGEKPLEVASVALGEEQRYQVPVSIPAEEPAPPAQEIERAPVVTPPPAPEPEKVRPAVVPPQKKETPVETVPESIPLPDRFPMEDTVPEPPVEISELPPVSPVESAVVTSVPVVPASTPEPVVPQPAEPVVPPADPIVIAQTPEEIPSSAGSALPGAPSARTRSGAVNVENLPRLSSQERSRLGLDGIRLNVLRPADKDQPDALAIINLKKVYVGETIPGTRARLIGVVSSGIGIEIESDGTTKQFRLPR
ncbi:MAG: hypothetical protein GX130_04605 [Candidatus Hydrogenedens sp.]|jgi:hypothetical protein|nr:hypothetical protein [Candidatus Hydrogenedens sp.]